MSQTNPKKHCPVCQTTEENIIVWKDYYEEGRENRWCCGVCGSEGSYPGLEGKEVSSGGEEGEEESFAVENDEHEVVQDEKGDDEGDVIEESDDENTHRISFFQGVETVNSKKFKSNRRKSERLRISRRSITSRIKRKSRSFDEGGNDGVVHGEDLQSADCFYIGERSKGVVESKEEFKRKLSKNYF